MPPTTKRHPLSRLVLCALIGLFTGLTASACVGVPASRPYVDWGKDDHAAVGAALYDSTSPNYLVEGAFVFGAFPMGDFDVAGSLQLDFSRGVGTGATLGGGGSLAIRYRFRLIESLEVVPEVSAGLVNLRSPAGLRVQAALVLFDFSFRYRIVEDVWVYVRPGVGAGASVFGTAIGDIFPAIRLSYGTQWAFLPWLRLYVEGSTATEVGVPTLALGLLTVF